MKVYTTLIATVGASLFGNIQRNEKLKREYDNGNLQRIVDILASEELGDPENERVYGSEINSTISLIRNFEKIEPESKFQAHTLYLLVSDTEIGNKIGTILEGFFKNNKSSEFLDVQTITIDGLTDKDEIKFKKFGLRNVVKEFAKIAKKYKESVIVNSTGGYKAQIAFALALGQALKFPVYYRFEGFKRIIKMPPLPVSLDWNIYVKYHDFLEKLEENVEEKESEFLKEFSIRNFTEIPEELKVFIDRETVDSNYYLWISPMGQVFLEAARELIEHSVHLPSSNKKPEDKIQHNNKESNSYAYFNSHTNLKNLAKIDWVEKVRIEGYGKNANKRRLKVRLVEKKIKIEYGDEKGMIFIIVETTGKKEEQLLLAKNKIFELLS